MNVAFKTLLVKKSKLRLKSVSPNFFVKIGVFVETDKIDFMSSKIPSLNCFLSNLSKTSFFYVFGGGQKSALFALFGEKRPFQITSFKTPR